MAGGCRCSLRGVGGCGNSHTRPFCSREGEQCTAGTLHAITRQKEGWNESCSSPCGRLSEGTVTPCTVRSLCIVAIRESKRAAVRDLDTKLTHNTQFMHASYRFFDREYSFPLHCALSEQ